MNTSNYLHNPSNYYSGPSNGNGLQLGFSLSASILASGIDFVPQSLENTFEDLTMTSVNIHQKINFTDYLHPNEGTPEGIKKHLALVEDPGLIVSTGTERSFFDLALCAPQKCHGLVVRDINPRVKAYVDFNTMLLRLAEDRVEYEQLSSDICSDPEETIPGGLRIETIRKKLEESDIPEPVKSYYLKHLDDFATIYFLRGKKEWRTSRFIAPFFQNVQYQKDDRLFEQLQTYAKAGKIIATMGDINDLRFLADHRVAVIDVSNIPDYILLNPQGGGFFFPLIIWTRCNSRKATYLSVKYTPVLEKTIKKIDAIIEKVKEAFRPKENGEALTIIIDILSKHLAHRRNKQAKPPMYSKSALKVLKMIERNYLFEINLPQQKCLFLDNELSIETLNDFEEEEIEKIINNPELKRFIQPIMDMWMVIEPKKYLPFCQTPEGKGIFLSIVKKNHNNQNFKSYMQKSPELQSAFLEACQGLQLDPAL